MASLSGQVKFMYKRMNWKMCHARVQRLILYVVLSAHHESQWLPRRLKLVVAPRLHLGLDQRDVHQEHVRDHRKFERMQ